MHKSVINTKGFDIDVYSLNTVIVGTGAAGFNAADSLYSMGQKDLAIVTEGIKMGTSRNTGSDKQTYYKLTLSGDTPDSVMEMAKTLFNGGSMHGDIALVESALSARCFFKLADIGVPFPHNRYGEYTGYKTDHDPRQRATSAGPLTSRYMTEKLEEQVASKGIKIFDEYQVIGILTQDNSYINEIEKFTQEASNENKSAIGLIALNLSKLESKNMGFTLFNCTNLIYATGGPAGMYDASVYPISHTGSTGIAFEAGAKGINLTESQYGIASTKFRWNLSGTYQQVLPRYVSTDSKGEDEKEFLLEHFPSKGKMLDAIFLKGYQWPFDPRKVTNFGSSLIDLLVYNEIQIKGRKVFLDFAVNTNCTKPDEKLDFTQLGEEAFNYLENSGALFGTPIERLKKMNQPAIDLYMNNGIDLAKEYLEIDVCAQHNNGGLMGNIWWESNVRHLFPIGEVNGTFGVYRPGGSALNSTQVGSFRAAQYIRHNYMQEPLPLEKFNQIVKAQLDGKLELAQNILSNCSRESNIFKLRESMQRRMSKLGAHIRSLEGVSNGAEACRNEFITLSKDMKLKSVYELPFAFTNRDILITQFVYLSAIKEYIQKGGNSRGSYLISNRNNKEETPTSLLPERVNPTASAAPAENSGLLEATRVSLDDGVLSKSVCIVELKYIKNNLECGFEWEPVRPIPQEDNWFENVWNNYREGNIIK